ncbi:amino acid adenylation domain-containing protein [Nocardia sp. NPDC005978]|uniref:amino acid adenylation domain-containing protein n=1 Tax=Nocardia sp. NPDC005978 TaxID=3156725 RepID=UPI0033BE211C
MGSDEPDGGPFLIRLFERWVAQTPDCVAVESCGARLTYAALAERAAGVAKSLRPWLFEDDTRVGVCLPRGVDLVVSIIGVVAAGAAYVPLDPGSPVRWNRDRLLASAATVVLTDRAHSQVFASTDIETIVVENTVGAEWDSATTVSESHRIAYVMFTSGTTGVPKAVAVSQRGVANLVTGQNYGVSGPGQCQLLHSPITFDASTFEIWGSLLTGGRLVVAPDGPLSIGDLAHIINDHRVTSVFVTTAMLRVILDEQPNALRGLQQLVFGGEAVFPNLLADAGRLLPGTRLVAAYGPTEATTFIATHQGCHADGAGAVIGFPLRHVQTYVLGPDLRAVAPGVPGELCIAGAALAVGYLGAPAETAERFVPNPFANEPGQRLYRSGDRVRMRENGSIEFIGRIDDQVKIRGKRVEPVEVERALLDHPGVVAVRVSAEQTATRGTYLVAHITLGSNSSVDESTLRAHMAAVVPDHLRPQTYVLRSTSRLTAHGKVEGARRVSTTGAQTPDAMYSVVVNGAGQCALWPTGHTVPVGWSSTGYEGSRVECRAAVEHIWPDILGPARWDS